MENATPPHTATRDAPPGANARSRTTLLVVALVALTVAAILMAYRGVTDGGYHFDDHPNITRWPSLQMTEFSLAALWRAGGEAMISTRPVASMSFAIDWWRGGGAPAAMLQTNLLIHIANALLAFYLGYCLLTRTAGRKPTTALVAAAAAALVWALHPIQVQSVAYVVQRMASLAHLFTLLSLIAALYALRAQGTRRVAAWAAAAGMAVLGALSKETAWALPALFWLLSIGTLFHGKPLPKGLAARIWLWLPVVALAVVAIDLLSQQGPVYRLAAPGYAMRDFDMAERLLTQPRVLAMHVGQLLWPNPEAFALDHAFETSTSLLHPVTTLPAMLALFAYLGWGIHWLLRPERRLHGALWLWVPAGLAIESSVIPLEMVFEHRFYLPSVGIAWLLALGLSGLLESSRRPRPAVIALPALLYLGLLGAATAYRIPEWQSDLSLGESNVRREPQSPRAWMNYAVAQIEAGRHAEALVSLERSLAIDPAQPNALVNRGLLRARQGDAAGALADFEHAVALRPDHPEAHLARANVLRDLGRLDEAMRGYQHVLELAAKPASDNLNRVMAQHWAAVTQYQIGLMMSRLGRRMEAVAAYQAALAIRPDLPEPLFNLASLALADGDARTAAALLDRYVAVAPADADGYFLRAKARLAGGAAQGAVADLERTLAINPADGEAAELLGRTWMELGDAGRGRELLTRACRMGRASACLG